MGITAGYPRLSRRFGKIMGYIQLCRVFTLVAPLVAGILGVLTPVKEITFANIVTATYVGVTLALAQACGQCLNQYADSELDKLIKPYRPVPSGLVTREEALGLSWLLAIFAVGRAFTIGTFFGLIVLVLLFFSVFYSLSPFSPRRVNPFLNTGWMAVSRGLLPIYAVISIYGSMENVWRYAVLAFLWVLAYQATKDIGDVEGDRKFGIKTIPNTYGLKGFLIYEASLTVIVFSFIYVFLPKIMLLLIPISLLALLGLRKQVKGAENNLGWVGFYSGLAFIYVLIFAYSRLS
jgi:geranylgeranylglycerol-phosphate geranylgeranyltransferase